MGNGAVKNIVLVMALLVSSILIGSQISGGIKDSLGAFALIALVAVGFVMLVIGKKAWQLMLFLPAVLTNCCFTPDYFLTQSNWPWGLAAALGVAACWVFMICVGIGQYRWRAAWLLDIAVILVALYMVSNYIRYPTSVHFLDPDAEYVGGKEYLWCIMATLYYFTVSAMCADSDEVLTVIKRTFYVLVIGQLFYLVWQTGTGQMGRGLSMIGSADVRFPGFRVLAPVMVCYAYSALPMFKLMTTPRMLLCCFAGLVFTMSVGNREILAQTALVVAIVSFIKKEILLFASACLFIYAVLFFGLSATGVLRELPVPTQRTLYLLPGMDVSPGVKQMTQGSSETRKKIWRMALDPRYGYIKDYIWGDGFQTSTAYIARSETYAMRHISETLTETQFNDSLARSGNWHNGWLATIHRTGIVGLALVNVVFIIGFVMAISICVTYRKSKLFAPYMCLMLPFFSISLTYVWGTQTLINFFASYQTLAIIKLLYCASREKGIMRPLFVRYYYVPMMIRDLDHTLAAPHAA